MFNSPSLGLATLGALFLAIAVLVDPCVGYKYNVDESIPADVILSLTEGPMWATQDVREPGCRGFGGNNTLQAWRRTK